MRRRFSLARMTLVVVILGLAAAAVGCQNEDDPRTWIPKLSQDAKRTGAMVRLRRIYDTRMATTTPPQNPAAATVRDFLNVALAPMVTAFQAHPDDVIGRREAIEIFATCNDPRAVPALVSALTFRPGVADSERIALRAAQALKDHAADIPAGERTRVIQGLIAVIDRAQGNLGNAAQIRFNSIMALGAMHATEAVETLVRLLSRPLGEQDINTARACADALGEIGDPRGVDPLVYGLFLNIRQNNAFNNCVRALGRLGAAAAVPRLVVTLNGQNAQVNALIEQYRNIPNAPAPPDGLVASTAADVLRTFASPDAADALLTLLNNRETNANVRSAAGEALAYTAIASPALRPRILAAITAVFNEGAPTGDVAWMAPAMAPRLSLIGDASSVPIVLGALRHRAIQDAPHANARVDLLMPFASIARHADVPSFDEISRTARQQLEGVLRESPDAEQEIRPYLTALDRINNVISVVRECTDGDRACYQRMMGSSNNDIVRKAAYMIGWTTPPGQAAEARNVLFERLNHTDMLVRRSIMTVIDSLSPTGCADCLVRLQQLIDSERGQESRILSHLDAMLLMGRLRSRAGAGGAAATPAPAAAGAAPAGAAH